MTFYKKAYEYSDEQTCLPISIAASVEVMSEVKERMGNYLQTTCLQGKYWLSVLGQDMNAIKTDKHAHA